MTRHTLGAAAAALACAAVLTACGGSGPTATPSGAAAPPFDVRAALALADQQPYAADIESRTRRDGTPELLVRGEINVDGGTLTGELRRFNRAETGAGPGPRIDEDLLLTRDHRYLRDNTTDAAWRETPVDTAVPLGDFAAYAGLLLDQGPTALRGTDAAGAAHLAGRLRTDQLRTADPALHGELRTAGIDFVDCDQWIDPSGRTTRFEQTTTHAGRPTRTAVDLRNFTDPRPIVLPAPLATP